MSRGKIVALICALLLLGTIVVLTVIVWAGQSAVQSPTPGETELRGKWRPNAKQCSDGVFMIVEDERIHFVGGADKQKQVTLGFEIEIVKVPQADGPILILHPWHEPPGILMLLHTDLRSGTFKFAAAEWTESTKAALGDQFEKVTQVQKFLESIRSGQPYHRCP